MTLDELDLQLKEIAEKINEIAENEYLVCGQLYSDLKSAYNLLKDGVY